VFLSDLLISLVDRADALARHMASGGKIVENVPAMNPFWKVKTVCFSFFLAGFLGLFFLFGLLP
jgi:hypothetical protein